MANRLPPLPDSDAADAAGIPLAQQLNDEQRWSSRKSTVLAGVIISDQIPGAVPCVVRDVSATGALIDLRSANSSVIASASGLPGTFALVLQRDNSEVRCEVAWRQQTTVGVRFISAFKTLPARAKPVKPAAKRKWF
ncbi:MAG: PilZ domain-containing protein [Hyphomicrobium sp.]